MRPRRARCRPRGSARAASVWIALVLLSVKTITRPRGMLDQQTRRAGIRASARFGCGNSSITVVAAISVGFNADVSERRTIVPTSFAERSYLICRPRSSSGSEDDRTVRCGSIERLSPAAITWLGHATVLIEIDGVRLLTDPTLRGHIGPLVRIAPPVDPDAIGALDGVLLSHLHADHTHLSSLRDVARGTAIVAPRPAAAWFARHGLAGVAELGTRGGDEHLGAARDRDCGEARAAPAAAGTGRRAGRLSRQRVELCLFRRRHRPVRRDVGPSRIGRRGAAANIELQEPIWGRAI